MCTVIEERLGIKERQTIDKTPRDSMQGHGRDRDVDCFALPNRVSRDRRYEFVNLDRLERRVSPLARGELVRRRLRQWSVDRAR